MKVKIVCFAGSLRKQSYNRSLLRAAIELAPSHCILEECDIAAIPLYNQDEEAKLPQSVVRLKTQVRAADAVLIATPEYNYSIPGVLKNVLDWGSRPYGDNAWDNKPVALMGASPGILGTSRAQYHLRQVFVTLNMHPLNQPEVMVGTAHEKFDAQSRLIDSKTRQKVGELVTALANFVLKFYSKG